MLNLIRKDLIIAKNYLIKTLFVSIFFCFIFQEFNEFARFIGVVNGVHYTLFYTCLYYGGLAKEEFILNSLPTNRKEVVIAKYCSSLIFLIGSIVIVYLSSFLARFLGCNVTSPTTKIWVIGTVFIIFHIAIQLCIYFMFGYKTSRILGLLIYTTTFGVMCGMGYIIQRLGSVTMNKVYMYSLILTIALFIVSILISIKVYERKEAA